MELFGSETTQLTIRDNFAKIHTFKMNQQESRIYLDRKWKTVECGNDFFFKQLEETYWKYLWNYIGLEERKYITAKKK